MKKKIIIIFFILIIFVNTGVYAEPDISLFGKDVNIEDSENPEDYVVGFEILLVLTILTLAPAILIMMSSFTRIIIVLSFIRNALGTQQTPPNQVLIGLALFLTFFVMAPIGADINENALQPYLEEEIGQAEAIDNAMVPIREFMYKQTRDKDLALFVDIADVEEEIVNMEDIPTKALIPAFIISELKTAFQISFIIFIPFLIIDMVVASTLMSMGMMMLPPVMISLPFKILLFIMVDGWNLIIRSLINGFS
ncbi:flagellar type III secretion system pore protein FliP [Clostridium sp. D2Q-14]|uniref:flagellar type III secretion system pore protein FliP n=1 Tax=Anaeromonas gelatinilytica TaxID=2683194 RepID=UPI00193B5E31|nr:flagellar type III secretion system pore protein FliP [Anaeromonas gelatinilytica]MBS4536038.1 flagellar type III secretion system pore protein FliP [Anaeromonas gelatinilytica]